jgi:hypothetical protein
MHAGGIFDPNFSIDNVQHATSAEQADLCVRLVNLLEWEMLALLAAPQQGGE